MKLNAFEIEKSYRKLKVVKGSIIENTTCFHEEALRILAVRAE